MIFRITAKRKPDADLAIFWFNDIVPGMEIDQAGSSLPFSFSFLAALTYSFVALVGGCAI